ncbi:DUF262 domain-containing protein [Methylobacterium aquaticum]|uniref:DUF262 domain-containing protein n=1 Tax=Methylobacterium aquaticum TaxID=270351 RepID=UPI00193418C1|nr:DUF262 domain-containing protein [Methylobacterium aquaticum]QRE73716.1 DUF262 domain-containing protein [Methylobacterium aquaticum]
MTRFNEAQTQLVTQTADVPLGTLAQMVESGGINLQPAFQRRERWKIEKQTALIESFLLNVPVPPIYLSEEFDGTYTAIDGKQRLHAINEFIHNRIALKDPERLQEANGIKFENLPIPIQNSLMLRPSMRVVTLLRQTHTDLKYEVFLRLNRGGESLNDQEIRNVAFRGVLNDAIYELAGYNFLKQQLKIENAKSAPYRNMEDAEYVLRFMTLSSDLEAFSGRLSKAMDDFMKKYSDQDEEVIQRYKNLFIKSLARCETFWGENAFKRPEGDRWRSQFLAGMYDAQMLAVARLENNVLHIISGRQDRVLEVTRNLFQDDRFEESVRTGTNTPQRIRYRVDAVYNMLMAIARE